MDGSGTVDMRRIVLLDKDKLQSKSPQFPQICIVCKRACADEEKAFNALALRIGVGVEFITTQYFSIPMHTTTDKCAKVFTRKWMLERYRGLGAIALLMLISIGSIPLLHEKSVFVFFGSIVTFIVVEMYFEMKSDLPLQISEALSSKSSGNYEFEFLEESYANEFRRLNRQFLAD